MEIEISKWTLGDDGQMYWGRTCVAGDIPTALAYIRKEPGVWLLEGGGLADADFGELLVERRPFDADPSAVVINTADSGSD